MALVDIFELLGTTELPGAQWGTPEIEPVLNATAGLAVMLRKIGHPWGQQLIGLYPSEETTDCSSGADVLKQINTGEVLRLLEEIERDLPSVSGKSEEERSALGQIKDLSKGILSLWKKLLQADPSRRVAEFNTMVSIRGPEFKIERIRTAVNKAIDDAILGAIVELRLGFNPKNGELLILDEESPSYVLNLSLTGDALKKRIVELGGTLVSDAEVVEFLSDLAARDEDRQADGESDDDDEPSAQGGWAAN